MVPSSSLFKKSWLQSFLFHARKPVYSSSFGIWGIRAFRTCNGFWVSLNVTTVVKIHVDQKPSCEEVPKWVNFARDFRILTSHFPWTFLFPPDFRPAKDWPIKNTNNFIFFSENILTGIVDQKKPSNWKPRWVLFLVKSKSIFIIYGWWITMKW